MVIQQGAVQPRPAEHMGFYIMTVMAAVRPVVVGPVQGVALAARCILALVVLVPVIIPV